MPWKESDIVSERVKFIGRLLEGERMSDLCREFGISRKTGYKIFERYKSDGLSGLTDQSRASKRQPNKTSNEIINKVIETRKNYPTWGAPKIKAYLEKKLPIKAPAISTIHVILEKANLIKKKKRRVITKAQGTLRTTPTASNQLWCADFKGQFRLGNREYCYPLTITDRYSRYVLCCEAMESTKEKPAIAVFREVFKEFGVPEAILTDNGVPFGSASKFGLSALSVFCLRQGIKIQRIEPGKPQQNGSHERMHRTLKAETAKKPKHSILPQQELFDQWRAVFNNERPHQAIDMQTPCELYQKSEKDYDFFQEPLHYPDHQREHTVTQCGSISKTGQYRIFIGLPFAGERLGIKEIDEGLWQVDFMHYTLGVFDKEIGKLQTSKNPFLEVPE